MLIVGLTAFQSSQAGAQPDSCCGKSNSDICLHSFITYNLILGNKSSFFFGLQAAEVRLIDFCDRILVKEIYLLYVFLSSNGSWS